MESIKSPLSWRERVFKWVPSYYWFCRFLCPACHARSRSPCGVGSCPSTHVKVMVLATLKPPLFPFRVWDTEVVGVMYHFTPFSTESLGPKPYRRPGPPPPLRWCGAALSSPKRGLSYDFCRGWRMSVEALDLRVWGPLVPRAERDNSPTRVGFDSQWALAMSCCFCMFCSASLGILNRATQAVLSGTVHSLCPSLPALMSLSL